MKKKQGISLIVLVITIIVMIILAAAVVITLSNTGIINRANAAVKTTNEKQIEQLVSLAWAEAYAEGMRDNTQIKKYIEQKLEENKVDTTEFNVIVGNNGVEIKRGYSVRLAMLEDDDTFRGKPIVYCTEQLDHDKIIVEDKKIILVINEGKENETKNSFDIIEGEFAYDVVDMTDYMGRNETVYGLVFNSQNKIVADLEKEFLYDEYIVVLLEEGDDTTLYTSGEYYFDYSFWVSGYFDKTILLIDDLIGIEGISSGIQKYKVIKNNETIYDAYFHDEDFAAAKEIAESVRKRADATVIDGASTIEITTSEYTIIATKGLYHKGVALTEQYYGEYVYDRVALGTEEYNLVDMTKYPILARNKATGDTMFNDTIKSTLEALSSEEKEEWLIEYDYYIENKYHAFKPGIKFVIE